MWRQLSAGLPPTSQKDKIFAGPRQPARPPRPARSHMLACLAASAFVPQPRCQWAGAASHRAAWLMAASPDEEKQSKVDPKVERDAAAISDGIINAVDTVAAIGSLLNPRGVVKPTRSALQAATAANPNPNPLSRLTLTLALTLTGTLTVTVTLTLSRSSTSCGRMRRRGSTRRRPLRRRTTRRSWSLPPRCTPSAALKRSS